MSVNPFQAGGMLRPGAAYCAREADVELPARLRAGEVCAVLAPRQMGKSSLRARTAARLEGLGLRTATLDLSAIGAAGLSPETWLLGLLDELCCELGLDDPLPAWQARAHLPPVKRWRDAMHEISAQLGRLVVFIDEVDAVLGLPFPADDLFTMIRALAERPDDDGAPAPTFCLLGVAAPIDLMRSDARTPFNIGRIVRLEDLTRAQCEPFERALSAYSPAAAVLLDAIWARTLGHPYMTQRMCATIAERGWSDAPPEALAAQIADELFLAPGPMGDINLASAARSLLQIGERGIELVGLYRRVREGLSVPADEADPVTVRLLLTGMVARQPTEGRAALRVRNPIFAQVFDRVWIENQQGRRALMDATSQWISAGRRTDDLLRGSALERARRWAEGRLDLAPDEVAYLLASAEHEQAEALERTRLDEATRHEATRREQAERHLAIERRQGRRLSFALAGAVVALIAAGLLLARLREAGRSLDALERSRAEVWASTAAPLSRVPGEELAAISYGLRAAQAQREVLGNIPPSTLLSLSRATATASRQALLPLGDDSPTSVLWAPGGALIVGTTAGRVERWDPQARRRLRSDPEATGAVQELLALPEGWLSAGADGWVRVHSWDGASRARWRAHERGVDSVALAPDGARLATTSSDGLAKIWSLDGQLLATLTGPGEVHGHTASLFAVVWASDGAQVAAGAEDDAVWVWDVATGGPGRRLALPGGFQPYAALALPDGEILVGGIQGKIQRLRLADGAIVERWTASASYVGELAWASDGARVFTASADGVVRRWTLDGTLDGVIPGAERILQDLAPHPDGQTLAIASTDHDVLVWRGHSEQAQSVSPAHGDITVSAVWLGPDRVATAAKDGLARLWTPSTGQTLDLAHPGLVDSVAAGPPGQVLTTAADGLLRRWDAGTGALRGQIDLGGRAAQLLPSGRPDALLAVQLDGRVQEVDLSTGEVKTVVVARERTQPARYLADRSPDGALLVAPADDDDAGLWSLTTGALLRQLSGHIAPVRAAAFSPDGRVVLTGARDSRLRLWDVATGALLRELEGHGSWIYAVAFSPDGRLIASGSVDGTARLWDAATGEPIAIFSDLRDQIEIGDPRHFVASVAFSPDSARLLATGSDHRARIYPTTDAGLLASACGLLFEQDADEIQICARAER